MNATKGTLEHMRRIRAGEPIDWRDCRREGSFASWCGTLYLIGASLIGLVGFGLFLALVWACAQ